MKYSNTIDLQGRLHLRLKDRQGRVVRDLAADNDIVLSGRDMVAKLFINEPIAVISHLAVGSGSTAVNPRENIELENEIFRTEIQSLNPDSITDTSDGRRRVLVSAELDFDEGNDAPLTEAGLFNAETDGTMYNRVVFPPVSKTSDFTLTFVWEVIF
ncbi:MAG: hypothetical protein AAFP19_05425 [Bacteroidota bacterium]